MKNPLRLLAAALLVALAATPAHAQSAFRKDSLAVARQYTTWLYTGQVDSLFAHHAEDARAVVKSPKDLEAPVAELATRAGTEQEVIEEKFVKRNGRTQYWRTAKFSQFGEPLLVRFAFNEKGEIIGMGLGPKSAAPPVDSSKSK